MPYCPESIGEQVVQIPFFHFLGQEHREAPLIGVAPEHSGEVLAKLGFVDRLVVYPVRAGVAELSKLARELRRLPCERAYMTRRKSLRTALLARLSTRAPISGFAHGINGWFQESSAPFRTTEYIAENYVRLLNRTVADFAADQRPDRKDYALIIPGGRTQIKRYPLPAYLEVAHALSARIPVRFLLGPGTEHERELILDGRDEFDVVTAPSLPELSRLVREASVVIANDCGPGHFAHVYDVPRVSIFDRSVDPAHWFFRGRNGALVQSARPGEIAETPPGEILRLAEQALDRATHQPKD